MNKMENAIEAKSTLGTNPTAPVLKYGKALKTTPIPGRTMSNFKKVAIDRYFTRDLAARGLKPLDAVEYIKSSSKIKDTDGRTVFEMKDVEIPSAWSQLAVDILVSKYFRKAGVPGTGHETSVKQTIRRVAHTIR
ncbi:MAG: hypothetical protein AABZ55_11975, partial [Bdellovibrionota bacterium]